MHEQSRFSYRTRAESVLGHNSHSIKAVLGRVCTFSRRAKFVRLVSAKIEVGNEWTLTSEVFKCLLN